MQEMTYGWPAEMLVKVVRRRGARIVEVPVSYHSRRAGKSKVSGTLRGTVLAARYILGVTLRYARYNRLWSQEANHDELCKCQSQPFTR